LRDPGRLEQRSEPDGAAGTFRGDRPHVVDLAGQRGQILEAARGRPQ
jgi:hypothetical protein